MKMNKKQYNNIIEHSLQYDCKETDSSLDTARTVFNNMGVALPQGTQKEVFDIISTNEYMGWKRCTLEEAKEAANNGTAAIGINEDKIVILSAEDEEQPAPQTASVLTLTDDTPAVAVADLQYYAYGLDTTTIYPIDYLTGVQTFSYATDGNIYLSPNFRVGEFRCKDGTDEILIDMSLVRYLQAIRDWAGSSITINSGYRTPVHNQNIGGASGSQHLYGKAADIICSGKTPLQLAQRAETLGMKGIEWNSDLNYTHIDTRSSIWHVKRENGVYINISSFYNL